MDNERVNKLLNQAESLIIILENELETVTKDLVSARTVSVVHELLINMQEEINKK